MSSQKSISSLRYTLMGISLLFPLFANASETDAIGFFLAMIALFAGWIIFHIVFLIAYILKRTSTLMVCLSITSLGLFITGVFMFYSNNEPPMPSNWDERALLFMFLGLLGPGAMMINKPIRKN